MNVLLVAAGGAAGASLRYLLDRRVQRAHGSAFPWGTFTVNVLGSLILGLLTGFLLWGTDSETLRLLVGVGLCGSLTTFSTFGYETIRLFTERARLLAVLNVAGTVLAGFAAGTGGLLLAALLT